MVTLIKQFSSPQYQQLKQMRSDIGAVEKCVFPFIVDKKIAHLLLVRLKMVKGYLQQQENSIDTNHEYLRDAARNAAILVEDIKRNKSSFMKDLHYSSLLALASAVSDLRDVRQLDPKRDKQQQMCILLLKMVNVADRINLINSRIGGVNYRTILEGLNLFNKHTIIFPEDKRLLIPKVEKFQKDVESCSQKRLSYKSRPVEEFDKALQPSIESLKKSAKKVKFAIIQIYDEKDFIYLSEQAIE